MIYMDNAATTKTRLQVASFVAKNSVENYFNPSSIYKPSVNVKKELDEARKTFLELLNANQADKIIFTASATETNNLVLNGLAKKNKKILVSNGEHPSIFETAKNLIQLGYNVEFVNLTKEGTVDLSDLEAKLSLDTGLVSIIHVSNETGAINDIGKISKLIKSKVPTCLLHCDGVQAFGKVKINLANDNVDAYTMSSHKIHGPKGVACLYLRNGINIKPQILGGGQEAGIRSGTENAPAILGFCMASRIMYEDFDNKRLYIKNLKDKFINLLKSSTLEYQLNSTNSCLDNILSISFLKVRGEVLVHCLEDREIYVSTGSACSSKTIGNRVLTAMKQDKDSMLGNIRFSFSDFNTEEEVEEVVKALQEIIPTIKH